MDGPILAIAAFLVISTALHLLSSTAAAIRLRRGMAAIDGMFAGPVTIIRPLCGLENHLERTLRSSFHLNCANYEILFCVASSSDPAVPLVQRLIAEHADVPARLLTGNHDISANPKLNNMVKGWDAARGNWILMADSNVVMPPDYLQHLLKAWRGDTGLVCSPPIGCAPLGIWAELECAVLNTYQARWQFAADSAGFGFAQGKTMLWRREFLAALGGIKSLASEIAEDAAATKLVRQAGLRVRLVDRPIGQPLGRRGLAEIWRRQVRWARLRRGTFPALFAIEIFAGALFPTVACAILADAAGWPVAAAVLLFAIAWYGAEALLALAAGWHFAAVSPLAWILRDLMLPLIWLAGWAGRSFEWRGNAMRIVESKQSA